LGRERKVEVIKVEVPTWLAEKFRRYVAERYGLRRGALSRAVVELIERELRRLGSSEDNIDSIVGLGLSSDYRWEGEDLVEAIRRRGKYVPDRRQRNPGGFVQEE